MSTPDIPTRGPARVAPYVTAGVLIALAIVFPLLVPLYARAEPALWGIPFFYWYQLLWVFIASGLLAIAFVIVRREDRRRRAVARVVTLLDDVHLRDLDRALVRRERLEHGLEVALDVRGRAVAELQPAHVARLDRLRERVPRAANRRRRRRKRSNSPRSYRRS